MYVCAHTPVTLCTIEGIGKEIKEEKKLYCSSQDVAEPSLIFLIVNVLYVGKVWFSLVDSSCLLLEHVNCIFILHFQLH